jgi:hypothetical protein
MSNSQGHTMTPLWMLITNSMIWDPSDSENKIGLYQGHTWNTIDHYAKGKSERYCSTGTEAMKSYMLPNIIPVIVLYGDSKVI